MGDDKYNSKSITKEFNVNKIDPFFIVNNIGNVYVSENVEFNAFLESDAYGNISIIENNIVLNEIEFGNGEANIIVNGFTYGNKTIIIHYSGNYKYLAKNITKTFFVNKIKPNLIVNVPSRIEEGKDVVFEITLPSDVAGKVNVSVDNVTKMGNAKSLFTISISDLTEGSKLAYVTYMGDSKYQNISITKEFKVDKYLIPRTLPDIDATVQNINVGDLAEFIITLNPDAVGSVEVNVDGISNSSEVKNGQATVVISNLGFGSKNARIIYSGDDKYNDTAILRQFSVNKIYPEINVKCNNITIDDYAVFEISLNRFDASGMIIVRIGDKSNSSILTEGSTKIILNSLTSGIKTASISYLGDDKYLPRNVYYDISVNKLNSPINVKAEDINFTLSANVNVILPNGAGGTVKLIIGNETYERNIVTSNITFTIPDLNAGDHQINIIYSGDSKYKENTTTYTFNVNKIKPIINLDVNPNINYGDDANLSIAIYKAKGSISVEVDNDEIYNGIINENIIIPLNNLNVGSHLIKVSYSGDNNYLINSTQTTVTVKKLFLKIIE